jgi:hypothetical protein
VNINFGPKIQEVIRGWIKLHNEELHDLYSLPDIFFGAQIKDYEMGRACGRRVMCGGFESCCIVILACITILFYCKYLIDLYRHMVISYLCNYIEFSSYNSRD